MKIILSGFEKIKSNGFSLLETLISVSILIIIAASSFPAYSNFYNSGQFNESVAQAVQALRLAKEYSVSGHENSAHGVYFEINQPEKQDRYIFYVGSSYSSRDLRYDRINLAGKTVFFNLLLSESDINFSKGSGTPSASGLIGVLGGGKFNKNIVISKNGFIKIE